MGVQILTPAQRTNLTTVERLKQEADLVDADDALLRELVADASLAVETHCNRFLLREDLRETLPGVGGIYLHLERRPLVKVTSVSLDGEVLTDWRVHDARAGTLYRELGWTEVLVAGWPSATAGGLGLAGDPVARQRHPLFSVDYTAGFIGPEEAYQADTIAADPGLPGFTDSANAMPQVEADDIVLVSGFAASNNNGRFLVASRTAGQIVVSNGAFLQAEAAGPDVKLDARNLPRDIERATVLTAKAYLKGRTRDPVVTDSVIGPLSSRYLNDSKALPPAAVGLLSKWVL